MRRPLVGSIFLTGLLAILLVPCVVAQTSTGAPPAPAPAAAAQFAAKAEAVALDLVVRDKKGKLVTDLQPGEVEVLEDGVPQKLTSFRTLEPAAGAAASGAAPASPAASAAGTPPQAAATPNAAGSTAAPLHRVVMVFGRLSSDGRRLAQVAGDEFARRHVSPQTVVTVVRIDGGLVPVLDRTSDPVAVREAVRKATAAIGTAGVPAGGGTIGTDKSYSGQQLARFDGGAGARDLSQADSIAFVNALTKVVDAVKADPGRKTVLVFSEGFISPPGYEQVFADLLSRANRANVSFYGIDVRGLQLSSQLGGSGAALATAAAISDQQRSAVAGTPVSREQMTQDDAVQTSLRSDVVDTLQQLSNSTGGFLVTQTNDFGRPLARIAEDVRGYYEAAYIPSAPAAPGQFRRIEVRVTRKDVRVQARSGYYTTPPGPSASLAFSAFSQAELPNDFELRSRLFRFGREKGDAFDCVLKIEASLAKASFKPDAQGRLTGKMSLAGRVLDATGGLVESFGQDVALGGTPEQVQAARTQTLPLARRLSLPPGNYTVELVVRDGAGEKTSAQRLPLTVPAPEGGLAMSSLVLVSAIDPADAKADPSDPLLLGDKRIVPNLGRPVVPSPGAMLPVYYAAYVKPGSKTIPTVTLEVTRDGKVVLRGSSPTAAPDAAGRITGLLPVPLQKLSPGTYGVKVTVSDDKLTTEETTTVTIGS